MISLEDFDYPLPKELIAQQPVEPRDSCKLLVADRQKKSLQNKVFYDIVDYFSAGDILVLNDTKVFPAKINGRKKKTLGRAELLLLEPKEERLWRCLVQPTLKEGQEVEFEKHPATAVFVKRDPDGIPVIEFDCDPRELAEKIGQMPLPPYIKREPDVSDVQTYQTVYAAKEGAVASPTAGLHFTGELLAKIEKVGVLTERVTLHVGYGTFKPVENLEEHRMHAESFELLQETADAINEAKAKGHKIWAVGTTSLRVLETCVQKRKLIAGKGKTDLYIKPPFEFEAVDHLITNFHLPKTTLLLLVAAFMSEDFRKKAYHHALQNKYRFYSYGDAMLIL